MHRHTRFIHIFKALKRPPEIITQITHIFIIPEIIESNIKLKMLRDLFSSLKILVIIL
jgi:hypothetical protein